MTPAAQTRISSDDAAAARVAAIVDKLLKKRAPNAAPIAFEQDLHEAGLTSLDMVNLMLSVEEDFGIFVPQKRMTPDNFRSVASICALLSDLTSA